MIVPLLQKSLGEIGAASAGDDRRLETAPTTLSSQL
jgi:hypothetical protein